MTTPDKAGLCERLRAFHAGGYRKEAADTIERQAAEIERLREALDLASRRFYVFRDLTDHAPDRVCLATWADEARAALTGEDAAGSPTSQNTEPGLAFSDAGEP